MEKEKKSNLIICGAFAVFLFLIFVIFLGHIYKTFKFNHKNRFVEAGKKAECTVDIYPRAGLADSWDKRDIEFRDDIVTFTGTTYDGAVTNYSDSEVFITNLLLPLENFL